MFKSLVEGSATTIPLMLTGGFSSAAAMNAALETKAVDVIGLARPLCTQPSLGVEAWKALAKTHILQEEESFFFFFSNFSSTVSCRVRFSRPFRVACVGRVRFPRVFN